jgi:RNA polymerase sigma factor (sigma-70 family)
MDAEERTGEGPSAERCAELQRSYRESGEVLVREVSPRLRRRARWRGLDLEAAREVVQQAFAELFTRRPKLRNVEAWLLRVVDRRSIDWIRRSAAAQRFLDNLTTLRSPSVLPLDVRMSVEQALNRLPAKQQALVRLRYFEGCDEATAAERAGYSPKSVKKLLTRALCRLRSVLEQGSRADDANSPKPLLRD